MSENAARNFTQKASSYTKDTLEKSKTAAEETTKVMEQSYITASKGAVDFNLQLIDIAQANMNAAFDLARELSQAKSPSEFLELSAAHARKQLESLTEQTRHLTTLAQKVTTEATQPLQTAAKNFRSVS